VPANVKAQSIGPPISRDDQIPRRPTDRRRPDSPTIVVRIERSQFPDDNQPSIGKHQARAVERIMRCAQHSRLPGRTWLTVTLTLLVSIQTATPALAWGRLGHRVISRLAERHLTPQAKAAIAELLESGESVADASLWADENRRRLPKTAPWHYVDVPLDEPKYDSRFSGELSSKGGVVDKINEFRLVVRDKSKSVEDRRFALRFADWLRGGAIARQQPTSHDHV
jgi:hypothetical protein